MLTRQDAEAALTHYMTMVREMRNMNGRKPDSIIYSGMEDLLLTHGQFWTPQPRPARIRKMLDKVCFHNAYMLALRHHKRLRYVEGLAIGRVAIPLHHGWCVDEHDAVVDPTWEVVGEAYFGVEVSLARVKEARTSGSTAVLNDWKFKYRTMREPWTGRATKGPA